MRLSNGGELIWSADNQSCLLTWTQFRALFLQKYMPRTLRDRKKDEFIDLDQGDMCVTTYEAKFHVLSRYATQLVTTEEERIPYVIFSSI